MRDVRFDPQRIDTEEELRIAREAARRVWRRASKIVPLLLALGVLLWLASGIYMVNPGEQGVVRFFGREVGKTSPGLHYRLPSPIQQVDVVNVEAIRRIEVGFRTQQNQPARVATEALMLTGDENIVDAQLIAQYRVRDPSLFLFRLRDPEQTLHAAAQVALRSVVGNLAIDDVLTTGRADAETQTLQYLQRLMDDYQSGLFVTEVKLQVVDPPDEVKDAFNEVVRAREDRERQRNEAEAYREDILPKARGQAQQTIRGAEAYQQERVLQAQGDVARFAAVLEEYRKGRDVTRERLHLETIERVLAGVNKVVIDGGVGNVLPYLPLNELNRGAAPASSQPAPQPAAPSPGETAPQSGPAQQQTRPGGQPAPQSKPQATPPQSKPQTAPR
jgi:membrane protease subunit HflK